MAKRVLMRNESNKSSKSGSGPSDVSSLSYVPVSDVTQFINNQSHSSKQYDSGSAIWRDDVSEHGSLSNSNRAGSSSGGGIINASFSHSAHSPKKNYAIGGSEISATNLTDDSVDSLRHREEKLGGTEEYALETQFEYKTEEVVHPTNQSSERSLPREDEVQTLDFAPEVFELSNYIHRRSRRGDIKTERRESSRPGGRETQFESNEFLLRNDIEFDNRESSPKEYWDGGKETQFESNEVLLQNDLEFEERKSSSTRYQEGKDTQFDTNKVVLKSDVEFETYREAVKRRDKKPTTAKAEYSFRNNALGRSDSTKRLISESSAESSSARNSSVLSDTSIDFENVLYTESEHSSKHRSISIDTLESKDKAQAPTLSPENDVQQLYSEDKKPKEVAKRYVKNKRLKKKKVPTATLR